MSVPRVLRSLVLASRSPRRLALLRSLGLEVRVEPSGYRESPLAGQTPAQLAQTHARGKVRDVADRFAADVVLAADTVVDVDGEALGKPDDETAAARMLERLSGRAHLVHTAFSLVVPDARAVERCISTRVWFYPLSGDEIAAYVRSGEALDKAGGYAIQGRGATLVERIDGDYSTVVGLPVGALSRELRACGYALA